MFSDAQSKTGDGFLFGVTNENLQKLIGQGSGKKKTEVIDITSNKVYLGAVKQGGGILYTCQRCKAPCADQSVNQGLLLCAACSVFRDDEKTRQRLKEFTCREEGQLLEQFRDVEGWFVPLSRISLQRKQKGLKFLKKDWRRAGATQLDTIRPSSYTRDDHKQLHQLAQSEALLGKAGAEKNDSLVEASGNMQSDLKYKNVPNIKFKDLCKEGPSAVKEHFVTVMRLAQTTHWEDKNSEEQQNAVAGGIMSAERLYLFAWYEEEFRSVKRAKLSDGSARQQFLVPFLACLKKLSQQVKSQINPKQPLIFKKFYLPLESSVSMALLSKCAGQVGGGTQTSSGSHLLLNNRAGKDNQPRNDRVQEDNDKNNDSVLLPDTPQREVNEFEKVLDGPLQKFYRVDGLKLPIQGVFRAYKILKQQSSDPGQQVEKCFQEKLGKSSKIVFRSACRNCYHASGAFLRHSMKDCEESGKPCAMKCWVPACNGEKHWRSKCKNAPEGSGKGKGKGSGKQ